MINLLPPQQKIAIFKEKKLKIVLIYEIFFFVFFICLFLILFSIKLYLESQTNVLKTLISINEANQITKDIKDLQTKLYMYNKNLTQINNFLKNETSTVEMLEKIFKKVPPEIIITNFSFKKENFFVSLAGFAPSRTHLLILKNNLEEEFSEVSFPASVWINPTDINFSVSFKIKK